MAVLETRSDAELLELSLAGEERAFTLLYERLKAPIFRYAFYMTSSRTAAEEVVQEVFISLLKCGHRYRKTQGDVAGFAFGIARNFVRRVKRRERVYEALPDDFALEKLATLSGGEKESLSHRVVHDDAVARIRAATACLPDHYRQVVVLCDLCELSYAEAASRLECAVGTIRSRLNRAHALLAKKLKQKKRPQPELPAGTEECLI